MGKKGTAKYSKDDVLDLLRDLGFSTDINNGKTMGKGDHKAFSHYLYDDIKVVVPMARKDLSENEMSNICAVIVIVMKILEMDTSRFKRKEGVEGKMMKVIKNANKDISTIFLPTTRNILGTPEDEDVRRYVNEKIAEYKDIIAKSGKKPD